MGWSTKICWACKFQVEKTRLYLQDLFTLGITSNSWHYSCVALWNICYGSILSLVQILSSFISNALSYYYHTWKQKSTKFEPRMKLNHNIYQFTWKIFTHNCNMQYGDKAGNARSIHAALIKTHLVFLEFFQNTLL